MEKLFDNSISEKEKSYLTLEEIELINSIRTTGQLPSGLTEADHYDMHCKHRKLIDKEIRRAYTRNSLLQALSFERAQIIKNISLN